MNAIQSNGINLDYKEVEQIQLSTKSQSHKVADPGNHFDQPLASDPSKKNTVVVAKSQRSEKGSETSDVQRLTNVEEEQHDSDDKD